MPKPVEEERWEFKLNIPSTTANYDAEKYSIVTTQTPASGRRTTTAASSSSSTAPTDADGDSDTSNPDAREKKSLLGLSSDDKSSPQGQQCCWQYSGPRGMNLQSNILLKLSYRPAWQAIPEYTNSSSLASCCQCKSYAGEMEEEQVWEIYTQEQVVKTEKREITIRGVGKCQAMQVFLKPLFDHDNDDASQERMSPPREMQSSLGLHRQRMGNQQRSDQQEQQPQWSRFTEAPDSSPSHINHIVVTFAIPLTNDDPTCDPPLLWKVDVPRFQSTDVCIDTLTVFDGTVDMKENPTHVYIQGYQSWSYTGSVVKGKKQPQPAMPDMFSKAFNFGGMPCETPTIVFPPRTDMSKLPSVHELQDKRMYQSDYFVGITTSKGNILDEFGGPALVCGWLSQHEQLGTLNLDPSLTQLEMHATHRAQLVAPITTTDWAYAQLVSPHHYDEEPLVHYLHAAAAFNEARPLQNGPMLTGWCSWYHYYENISEENLRENFAKLATIQDDVPTNVAVVDDGYMTAWGDWDSFKPKKFTDMRFVSQDIERNGMRPGIWLAPFACDKHSMIAKQHPDWIIRNDQGRPANSSNCGKFFYGLDATNPHVREYVAKCIRRAVKDWGFEALKIDFLYAACLEGNGKYDLSMTRAQAMHLALQTIREAAGPNVFLIGCGCPVGVGIGYVDGMRISADTGPTWYPAFPLPWWDNGTLPSLRAMIRNSMTRASYGHRWWHNDPDCLLLGKTTSLTNDEVATACSVVGLTYEPTVMHIPPRALRPLPSGGVSSSKDGCHIFSFWSGNYTWAPASAYQSKSSIREATGPLSHKLRKHQSEIFHLKAVTPGVPQYIGSDMHFSCGYEVLSFDASQSNKVMVKLKTELKREGNIVVFLPVVDTANVKAFVGGLQATWSVAGSTPGVNGVACIGRCIKIAVTINADETNEDGEVIIEY
ncbi:unnamed protein product [Cylindrotheca closterium]|uniref:Alpha-galactosidase n=1 Tax=Cylindrotheca closterium TaxID=2856 RepID=A0AAD2FKY5_9STRA|nr:unnamed protein product [Cylindrotheca closterium]